MKKLGIKAFTSAGMRGRLPACRDESNYVKAAALVAYNCVFLLCNTTPMKLNFSFDYIEYSRSIENRQFSTVHFSKK